MPTPPCLPAFPPCLPRLPRSYLVLFLKFIASVVPTIEYDYTLPAGTAHDADEEGGGSAAR